MTLSVLTTIVSILLSSASGLIVRRISQGQESLAGEFADQGLQPAAVGDRAVQKPEGRRRCAISVRKFADRAATRGNRFFDFAVGAVDAGEVAEAAVAAVEDQAAAQGRFDRDQQVVAVDGDGLAGQGLDGHAPGERDCSCWSEQDPRITARR